MSVFTGFLTFCRRPERRAAQEAAHVAFFRRIRPEIRARSALTGFLTDVDNPRKRPTGFLTLNHRIPHFLSQRLTEFLTLDESCALYIKSLRQPEEKNLKEKEEALRVIHIEDKTPSNHFTLQSHTNTVERPYLA